MKNPATKPFTDLSADRTVVTIGAGTHVLHSIEAQNPNAADAWLHFWDEVASNILVGTTIPILTYIIPALSGPLFGHMSKDFTSPVGFVKGLSYAVTNAPSGGAATLLPCILNLTYNKTRAGT